MIANQMRKLFAFNTWAWDRVFDSVEKLPAEEYVAPRQLFEGSIHATEHRSQLTPLLYHLALPTQPLDYMLFQLRRM